MQLFDYINAAMQKSHAKSERKLCEMMGLKPGVITTYRRGVLPSEKTMMKLADLAGVPRWQALIDLHSWQAENDEIRSVYFDIYKRLKVTAQALIIALILGFSASPAFAELPTDKDRQYILRKVAGFYRKVRALFIWALCQPVNRLTCGCIKHF